MQDRVMQSRFVLVDNTRARAQPRIIDTKASARIVVPGYADRDVLDIRRDSPSACREAINVLLAISASKGREKWALLTADVQATFLKGEFQDKDRFLYCWPPKNGPALPGVQPGSLLLILKGVLWIERCTSQVVGENCQSTPSDSVSETTSVSWTIRTALTRRCVEWCLTCWALAPN